ncbi:hypothetical protein PDG61_20635 [Mycolicibacterium sp. BiH015]|uniref:hypothetical protein n=1 Tax=Mycolicibacterium sp. BiH015 TaxID=3018808 RepID=UPI0022E7E5CE|nr:hypothetical protein [Mycolicibacterium sp. BiH015]MDA2893336.1 hypothetical protein [Mycolicibacterium sp. BiH015]
MPERIGLGSQIVDLVTEQGGCFRCDVPSEYGDCKAPDEVAGFEGTSRETVATGTATPTAGE